MAPQRQDRGDGFTGWARSSSFARMIQASEFRFLQLELNSSTRASFMKTSRARSSRVVGSKLEVNVSSLPRWTTGWSSND